jgi:rhamnosyltransferase
MNINWNEVNTIDSHDWLIYAFFRSRKISWYIDNEAVVLYRQHESNQVGLNSGLLAYVKRLNMIQNGWYKKEITSIFKVIILYGGSDFNLKKTFLIKNFLQLRRNKREAFILLFIIILGIF